ncbi:EKC/KEOPS complex subunit TPRKB-like [Planococcus citri]|uniref:EKC/KEOPS complex subunit TPRKB-like n=1 Tax=Planococcus citri TaxID=170843 RepID=UPI0031FA260F
MTTFNLEYDETLVLMLFKNVSNIEEINSKLSTSTPPFQNCTIINYKVIVDPFQILIAANKAINSKHNGSLITKSLSTELLFNLSISDNITMSLNKFGYASNTQHLLLAIFEKNPKIIEAIASEVQGVPEPISNLCNFSDLEAVKQSYDVTDENLVASSLLNLVTTKIACKGV